MNVIFKNKNGCLIKIKNEMKKIAFTLMTLFALALMAGSAIAQTNTTPYAGGTYSYTLNGIKVANESTATVTYTGSGVTLPDPITVATTDNSITFDVTYLDGATDGTLQLTLEDGTSGCSNFIQLAIDVQAMPALDLAVVASETEICQSTNSTPADNTAASVGETNSFTFTVTPTVTNVSSGYSYGYTIALPGTTSLDGYTVTYAGSGTYNSDGTVTGKTDTNPDVFTITFNTTTGIAAETIEATLSSATMTVTTTSGEGTYTGTFSNDTDNAVVKALPSIGSFTIE